MFLIHGDLFMKDTTEIALLSTGLVASLQLKVCLHVTDFSPFNAPFNGPFYLISIVFMKNEQNGFRPILSVF